MQICVAAIFSIAILLGNSMKLRATVTGTVVRDGDDRDAPVCQMCCQGPAAVPGIPGLPGQGGPYGPAGSKGDSGLPGQKGDMGANGSMGEPGAHGNPGPKGDDGIGLPGKIGPRGPPGVVGPSLATGVKGQKGEPGETSPSTNQRVAFTAWRRTSMTASYDTRVPFEGTETLLLGTSFDLATGTFTCNMRGTYVFMFSGTGNSNHLYINLTKNDAHVIAGRSSSPSGYRQVSGGAVLNLREEDTVYLKMNGALSVSDSNHYTSFSGFLLYTE